MTKRDYLGLVVEITGPMTKVKGEATNNEWSKTWFVLVTGKTEGIFKENTYFNGAICLRDGTPSTLDKAGIPMATCIFQEEDIVDIVGPMVRT